MDLEWRTGLPVTASRGPAGDHDNWIFDCRHKAEGRWRVYGVQAPTKVIQVAQPMRVRERQAVDLALRTLTPFVLLMPMLVLFIWFGVDMRWSR